MFAKDYRKKAWDKIGSRGLWNTLALIGLIFSIFMGAVSGLGSLSYRFTYLSICGSLVSLFVYGAFSLSWANTSLNVIEDRDVKIEDIFSGFKDYSRALVAGIINLIFISLWTILLVIPGIVKALSYSMTFYILSEDKTIDANDARKKSMMIMEGHKWQLFCLYFSFIGWMLLCVLTFGILTFWITPYINTALAEFYRQINPKQEEPIINADEIFE